MTTQANRELLSGMIKKGNGGPIPGYDSKSRKRDVKSTPELIKRQKCRHAIELREDAKAAGMTIDEYMEIC